MLYKYLLLSCLLFGGIGNVYSQIVDTTQKASSDTEKVHSPKKAATMSAIFQGMGQAYNKKYWKIPIIYGGFTGLIMMFDYNQKLYVKYRDAYQMRIDPTLKDPYVGLLADNALLEAQKLYGRYRDLSIIGIGLLYILNIVDASVDGHLYSFDVSDKLSLQVEPIIFIARSNYYHGLSLNINLK